MGEFVLIFMVVLGTSMDSQVTPISFHTAEACEAAAAAMKEKVRDKKSTAQVYWHCAPTK